MTLTYAIASNEVSKKRQSPKRKRLQARAEWKRSRLEDICGFRPNPCEVTKPFTTVESCAETRFFDCPRYSDCLDVACIADWNGWTCASCPMFQANKKRWERIIRKVKLDAKSEEERANDPSKAV